jgi:hypothetical protein
MDSWQGWKRESDRVGCGGYLAKPVPRRAILEEKRFPGRPTVGNATGWTSVVLAAVGR